MRRFRPWVGDYRDPDCPYTDDFTVEDDEELYEREVDRRIDQRMEEEHEQDDN